METPNDTQSAETGRPSSAYSGGFYGVPPIFGPRMIPSAVMVNRVMYRKPTFRRYDWIRWAVPYRLLRAAWIKRTRRRWQADAANWRDVPMQSIIKLPNGDMVMHPSIYAKIKALAPPPPLFTP